MPGMYDPCWLYDTLLPGGVGERASSERQVQERLSLFIVAAAARAG